MLHQELRLKIQAREEERAEVQIPAREERTEKVPIRERLHVEEQKLKVVKISQAGSAVVESALSEGMGNKDGQIEGDDPSYIKSDGDSSEFVTPKSSPEQPCIAVRWIDRTKDEASQYQRAKDMIETRIEAETKSPGGSAVGTEESGQDSWVQAVVEKLSSDPGSEVHVKTLKREEETTKEKMTLLDDDSHEVKIEEKVKTDIAEKQVEIDKTFLVKC